MSQVMQSERPTLTFLPHQQQQRQGKVSQQVIEEWEKLKKPEEVENSKREKQEQQQLQRREE